LVSEINLAPAFTFALLSWYDANRRDLPWRDHPDAYAILVSEFMLQQTTVPAVVPYFERWMANYPTVEKLAEAGLDEVLLMWEGLGYYSRARNLHAAARELVSEYGGEVPSDPHELKKLPGVGYYTAAAVASIAYGIRAPALDANNLRVWSRLLATSDRKWIAAAFSRVLPSDRSGDLNQAFMDLGSSVCTPKTPDCAACPLAQWCRAYRTDTVSKYPQKKGRPEMTHIEAAIGIIVKDGKVLVQKRPEGGLLAGLWEFPGGKIGQAMGGGEKARHGDTGTRRRGETSRLDDEATERPSEKNAEKNPYQREARAPSPTLPSSHAPTQAHESPEEAVVREVREETGLRIQVCEKLGVFNHSYTRFRVKLHVFICKRKAGTMYNPTARWVTLEELEGLAMPSVNRKIVKKFEEYLDDNSCD
jgi:A/G-specific adenine glycosylase